MRNHTGGRSSRSRLMPSATLKSASSSRATRRGSREAGRDCCVVLQVLLSKGQLGGGLRKPLKRKSCRRLHAHVTVKAANTKRRTRRASGGQCLWQRYPQQRFKTVLHFMLRPVRQVLARLYALAKSRKESKSFGSLMIRGTLFCPPSLPRLFIHAAKPPGSTMSTRAVSMPNPPARWDA